MLILAGILGAICAGCIVARRSEISNWQQQRARLLALVEQRRGLIAGNQGLLERRLNAAPTCSAPLLDVDNTCDEVDLGDVPTPSPRTRNSTPAPP